jgi:hypothetical protein
MAESGVAGVDHHRLQPVGDQAVGSTIIDVQRHDDQPVQPARDGQHRKVAVQPFARIYRVNDQLIAGQVEGGGDAAHALHE